MKLLSGELSPSAGSIDLGHNVLLGYYAQNQDELLDGNDTVYETLEKIATGDVRTKLRDILGAFLFRGEDVNKKVSVLSGGEKSRLAMAKLILKPYNLLALDEPTNHMDIRSKDILKQSLSKYNGTLVIVSHDRDFLDGLVNKVLEFRDGRIREHIGSVSEYLERRKSEEAESNEKKSSAIINSPSLVMSQEKNHQNRVRREEGKEEKRKRQNIERCETTIEATEIELSSVEKELADLQDRVKLVELINKYDVLKGKLSRLMDEWESLHN
jgi:ATP-binding cassette subfamily F protein 3